jgi:hypothetical protein
MVVGEPALPPAGAAVDGDDDAVDRLRCFDLEPALAAATWLVPAGEILGHDALVAGGQRRLAEGRGLGLGGDDATLGQIPPARHRRQRLPSPGIRLGDERASLGHQAIEEMQRQRHLPHERLHAVDPPKPPHQLLEGQRLARLVKGHHFAVQDEGRPAEVAARDLDDIGKAPCHVGQPPRPHLHAIAVPVQLDAGAVVLVLERGAAAVRGQHGAEVVGDLGQHRQQRNERARRHAGQGRRAANGHQARHGREVAEKERGPAHGGDVGAPGGGDGLQQQALGDAGPHLAADDAPEEFALLGGGTRGQVGQPRVAGAPRAGAGRARDVCECLGDVAQRQWGPDRGFLAPAPAEPAHTEDARVRGGECAAGEEGDRHRHLVRRQGSQEGAHLPLLVQAAPEALETPAKGRKLPEGGHNGIVLSEFDSPAAPPVGLKPCAA